MVIDVDNVILVVDVVLAPVNVGVIAAQSSSLSSSSSSLSSLSHNGYNGIITCLMCSW